MLDQQPNDPNQLLNHRFRSKNGSYQSWVPANFASKARKPAEKYDLYSDWSTDGIQFRQVDSGESESGVHSPESPPLWNNIPPESPDSRIQTIVKGQKELMNMVKQLPESCYELTLKDLVDHTKMGNSQEQCLLQGKKEDDDGCDQLGHEKMNTRKLSTNKKIDGKKDHKNSSRRFNDGSTENKGLFLKMVFPFALKKSKKKKNVLKSSSFSAKINPKPDGERCGGTLKIGDTDWLKKMFSSGSDRSRSSSDSTRNGSSGNNSSSIRRRRGILSSCLPCFHS